MFHDPLSSENILERVYRTAAQTGISTWSSDLDSRFGKVARLRMEVHVQLDSVARRLVSVEDADALPWGVAKAARLSEKEEAQLTSADGFDFNSQEKVTPLEFAGESMTFVEWMDRHGFTKASVNRNPIAFAARWFQFLQRRFYWSDHDRGLPPRSPASAITGDTLFDDSANLLFVAGLRRMGIPARALMGSRQFYESPVSEEMASLDFEPAIVSEFFVPSIGWVPASARLQRSAADHPADKRLHIFKMGEYGVDREFDSRCLRAFGIDDGNTVFGGIGDPAIEPAAHILSREVLLQVEGKVRRPDSDGTDRSVIEQLPESAQLTLKTNTEARKKDLIEIVEGDDEWKGIPAPDSDAGAAGPV